MSTKLEEKNCSLPELQTEITNAEAFIKQQRFNSNFRPSGFVMAYAAAVLEHANAFATLAEKEQWLSIWPILRCQIEAMVWVHEFAVDPLSTWAAAELSALDSRIGWDKAENQSELVRRVNVWRSIGAPKKQKNKVRIEAINLWGKEQSLEASVEWFTTWKMCSQAAHLTGHQIQSLMMGRAAVEKKVQIYSSYEPDELARKFLYRESIRTLRFAMIRLNVCLDSMQNTAEDGEVSMKEDVVKKYKTLMLDCLEKSKGMIPGISTDVPREDDRV